MRNPMYLAVELVIVGQALLLRQASLLVYAAIVGAAVVAFVYLYEEPTLTQRYGAPYIAYQAVVPRWIPRPPGRTPAPGADPTEGCRADGSRPARLRCASQRGCTFMGPAPQGRGRTAAVS
jgi:hypothetical protein